MFQSQPNSRFDFSLRYNKSAEPELCFLRFTHFTNRGKANYQLNQKEKKKTFEFQPYISNVGPKCISLVWQFFFILTTRLPRHTNRNSENPISHPSFYSTAQRYGGSRHGDPPFCCYNDLCCHSKRGQENTWLSTASSDDAQHHAGAHFEIPITARCWRRILPMAQSSQMHYQISIA